MIRVLGATAGLVLFASLAISMATAEEIVVVPGSASGQTFGGQVLLTADGITEKNVKTVVFAKGDYKYKGNKKWVERNQAGQVVFTFDEAGRFPGEIKLYDPSRQVHISLDLNGMMVMYAPDGSDLTPLYPITKLKK